jgi:hypothetical protein
VGRFEKWLLREGHQNFLILLLYRSLVITMLILGWQGTYLTHRERSKVQRIKKFISANTDARTMKFCQNVYFYSEKTNPSFKNWLLPLSTFKTPKMMVLGANFGIFFPRFPGRIYSLYSFFNSSWVGRSETSVIIIMWSLPGRIFDLEVWNLP